MPNNSAGTPDLIRERDYDSAIDLGLGHPVLNRVLVARNVTEAAQLDYGLAGLHHPENFAGLPEAVVILAQAIRDQAKIIIVGDFDTDGATSCAVAVRGLKMLGASAVDFLVPNRFEFGYGLTPEIVDVALASKPDLIITVDNGISSIEGVDHARSNGCQVIVTDHHLPGDQLPNADAIVNPNCVDNPFPSKCLAGVGVIFYTLLAVRSALRDSGYFEQQRMPDPKLVNLLDLVALGTVADLVPLDHNNRILVSQGIKRIRGGACCEGIKALLQIAGKSMKTLTPSDMGFGIAPRLNAAGRMNDISVGIQCLLTDDAMQAKQLAETLDALNCERREVEAQMREEAVVIVDRLAFDGEQTMPTSLCLFDESWHQGVVGIVASRVKERYNRPAIVFAPGDGDEIKGSARSISGLNIRDALEAVSNRCPGMITRFGGHAMAAGLSMSVTQLDKFREQLEAVVTERVSEEDLNPVFMTDGSLQQSDLSLKFARRLSAAGPWGQAFPEPLFHGSFFVRTFRLLSGKHLKMELIASDKNKVLEAIMFNVDRQLLEQLRQVRLVYRLSVNHFRGVDSLQLQVVHLEIA